MKHSADYWKTLLARQRSSGLSLASFARLEGIDIKSLYYQAARFKKTPSKAKKPKEQNRFLPIVVKQRHSANNVSLHKQDDGTWQLLVSTENPQLLLSIVSSIVRE